MCLAPQANNVQQLFENLQGNQAISKYQLTMTKSMAAFYIWRLILLSAIKKAEIVKVGSLPHLSRLAQYGDTYAKYNAVGALLTLATSPDIRDKMCDQSLVNAVSRILLNTHDRTRTNAAKLLALFAEAPYHLPKLANVLPAVIEASRSAGSDWAHGDLAQERVLFVARQLAVALPGSDGLKPDQTWRPNFLQVDGVTKLLKIVETAALPESRAHALVSLESLCSEKGVPQQLVDLGGLPLFAKCLSDAFDESRAASASLLFTLTTELDRMETLIPAIPALVAMLNPKVPEPEGKKKKPKKKKGANLPPALANGVRFATACLRHLSFIDEAKLSIVQCGAIPFVVKGLEFRKKGMDIEWFEHATGLLYNLAMVGDHKANLEAAKAPKYISRPLHEAWLIFLEEQRELEESEEEQEEMVETKSRYLRTPASKGAPKPGFGSSAKKASNPGTGLQRQPLSRVK